ncbi:LysM peptidoglycan-binding domain-containing protein, partial [Ancrocorticia sp.]
MNRHAQAVRVTGAALAATTTFGLFGPAAHAGAVEQTVPLTRPALSVVGGVPAPSANAATPTVKAVAPTAKKASTYTVRSGDTLWDIAKKNGTSVSAIAKANGIDESAYLQIGQKLTIPGKSNSSTQFAPASSGKAASSTSGKRHVVVSGETLSSIALKYGTTPGAIQKSNSLANPNRIYVG